MGYFEVREVLCNVILRGRLPIVINGSYSMASSLKRKLVFLKFWSHIVVKFLRIIFCLLPEVIDFDPRMSKGFYDSYA